MSGHVERQCQTTPGRLGAASDNGQVVSAATRVTEADPAYKSSRSQIPNLAHLSSRLDLASSSTQSTARIPRSLGWPTHSYTYWRRTVLDSPQRQHARPDGAGNAPAAPPSIPPGPCGAYLDSSFECQARRDREHDVCGQVGAARGLPPTRSTAGYARRGLAADVGEECQRGGQRTKGDAGRRGSEGDGEGRRSRGGEVRRSE